MWYVWGRRERHTRFGGETDRYHLEDLVDGRTLKWILNKQDWIGPSSRPL